MAQAPARVRAFLNGWRMMPDGTWWRPASEYDEKPVQSDYDGSSPHGIVTAKTPTEAVRIDKKAKRI